jgi:signal transduction histidine kinase
MSPHRHTFLIVDDEVGMLESLRHLFRRDYNVLTAENGGAGLRLLHREEVHLILTDQRMPGMTGDEFLCHARTVQPDAIRLLFTGYADIQAVVDAINRAGIFRYILKPWKPSELIAIARQASDQYDLLVERKRLLEQVQSANAELRRANLELAESNQLKAAFLEVVSHEFNTPITIVKGLSELLRLMNSDRPPHEADAIQQIVAGTRQLSHLVTNTLKLLSAGDYQKPLQRTAVNLADLLRGAAEQVMPFANTRQLRFRVAIDDDLGQWDVDEDKIRDVVLNLISNAIKFTPDGGEISLTARRVGDDLAEIEVSDRGIGLEPKALDHLFDPFFTEFDPSRHSSGDFGFCKRGLGLGMSLVKRFVELHGGSVEAQSDLGAGTRITVRLPRGGTATGADGV